MVVERNSGLACIQTDIDNRLNFPLASLLTQQLLFIFLLLPFLSFAPCSQENSIISSPSAAVNNSYFKPTTSYVSVYSFLSHTAPVLPNIQLILPFIPKPNIDISIDN